MAAALRSRNAPDNRVPIAEAAVRIGMSRERLLRRVQSGVVPGGQDEGYWYVEREAVESLAEIAAA